MGHPRIELVIDADCPHGDLAREHLRRALKRCGLTPAWREWRLEVDYVPEAYRDAGSPSIFINGSDVAAESAWSGRSCRLYPAADGRLDLAPAIETIVDALTAVTAIPA